MNGTVINISKVDFKYYQSAFAADDRSNYVIIPTMELDNDAENQIPQGSYITDRDITDTGVELIQYAVGVLHGWDTDTDNQFLQPGYVTDGDLSDTGVERIQLPTVTDYTWDIDYEFGVWSAYQIDRELSDPQTEKIFIPVQEIDNDSEQQFSQGFFSTDHLSDENVEHIQTIIITITQPWDNDVEHQLQMQAYYPDSLTYDGTNLITLPPFVDVIEIVEGEEE